MPSICCAASICSVPDPHSPRPLVNGDLPYRRSVGILLLNPHALAFAGQRIDTEGAAWQLPQGGIDDGEDPETAAFRELREETGITQAEVLGCTRDWLRYDLPEPLAGKVWKGRYRGQQQKWFAMRHTGPEDEIDIGPGGEFSAWRWVRPDDLPSLIVPFKRALYEALLAEFAPIVNPERP